MAGCAALEGFLQGGGQAELAALHQQLTHVPAQDSEALIAVYQQALPYLEQALWAGGAEEALLQTYQQVFRELEAHIGATGRDERHHIILYIPVADRPLHLTACLDSLLQLCRLYQYGGYRHARYQKLSVLIGDDSEAPDNIRQHQAICRQFNAQGLETIYFGQQEQLQQLAELSAAEREQLAGVLGEVDAAAFYHKGSPRMRNIAALKLHDMARDYPRVLFYSLDSDQEFQVRVNSPRGYRDLYAINYFYQLDAIFSRSDACILTGKVVGDPPVSPAVMAGNFLEDVIAFLEQMAELAPQRACGFHVPNKHNDHAAAYHDMADMFGFRRAAASHRYPCPLDGAHDNDQCFRHFAQRVNAFFYGEHPTRQTCYEYAGPEQALAPARTVYPGNYVFNVAGLQYFIPFAPLKLRMNGPVMGRIVKATLKDRFISANLPMLHKRTVADTGLSEYRPDIHRQAQQIDLAGEFERQYFGDVLLFSIEQLTAQGYPLTALEREQVSDVVIATEKNLHRQYLAKQREIMAKLQRLTELLQQAQHWWQQAEYAEAMAQLQAFADNIEHNFGEGSHAYRLINSAVDKRLCLTRIINAIMHYPAEQQAWQQTLHGAAVELSNA